MPGHVRCKPSDAHCERCAGAEPAPFSLQPTRQRWWRPLCATGQTHGLCYSRPPLFHLCSQYNAPFAMVPSSPPFRFSLSLP